MTQTRDDEAQCSVGRLIQSHEGVLSESAEKQLAAHVNGCPECQTDRKSLAELEMEMLTAANDNARMKNLQLDLVRAKICLLVTDSRLERFARRTLGQELISDDDLKAHVEACVFCRRRSLIMHRRLRYSEHKQLPLAYRLSEEAVQEGMESAWTAVRRVLQQGACGSNVPAEGRWLALGEGVQVSRFGTKLTCEVSGHYSGQHEKAIILLPDHSERVKEPVRGGVFEFDDICAGECYLYIDGIDTVFFLNMQTKPDGKNAQETTLTAFLEAHLMEIGRQAVARIPGRWRGVLPEDLLVRETCTDAFLEIGGFPLSSENSSRRWLRSLLDRNVVEAIRMLDADRRCGAAQRMDASADESSYVRLCEQIGLTRTSTNESGARREAKAIVEDAMQQLPDRHRRIITLCDLEGRPLREAAETINSELSDTCMLRVRAHRLLGSAVGTAVRCLGGFSKGGEWSVLPYVESTQSGAKHA